MKGTIAHRMDNIQEMMENNFHLKNPNKVVECIAEVSKFWSVLSEEDNDYINAAQDAIEDQKEWK